MAIRNRARERWVGYGRDLAARQPERERIAAERGIPCPTPKQVRAELLRGAGAPGPNAGRWLAEGWREFDSSPAR